MDLRRALPQDQQRAFLAPLLVPGCVVFVRCDFVDPPKKKYLALVGPGPLFFVINSRINKFKALRPEIKACQVRLRRSDHPFLDHDSFLDCSEVVECMSQEHLLSQLVESDGTIAGSLSAGAVLEVVAVLRAEPPTVGDDHRRTILAALSPVAEDDDQAVSGLGTKG